MSDLGASTDASHLHCSSYTSDMTTSSLYSLGYAYWYDVSDYADAYVWAGTYQLPGIGPEIMTEDGFVDSDLILMHGPAPA